jgi:hypothetical protein
MSERSSSSADLAIVVELINVYRAPEENRIAKDSLLLLGRIVQLLEPEAEGYGIVSHSLTGLSQEVNGILTGMRSQFEALICPLIGRLVPAAIRELEEQVQLHNSRIALCQRDHDPSEIFDQLLKTGWQTHLTKEQWVQSPLEQAQTEQFEVWKRGTIEADIQNLQSLFDHFVTHAGTLGPVSDQSERL